MSIFKWLFGSEVKEASVTAPESAQEPAPDLVSATGVLFGLDPPDGHYFDVSATSIAWHVWIVPNEMQPHDRVATGCALHRHSPDDKACIRAAGAEALAEYARRLVTRGLSGQYPPKRTA